MSEEVMKSKEIMKPFKNAQSTTNLFMLGTNDMKEKLIPYSLADEKILKITSCQDVGLFRKYFAEFDITRVSA